jgi:hypothetical protein
MQTGLTVFHPGEQPQSSSVELAPEPAWTSLQAILKPLLGCGRIERVAVLHNGKRADMFVDEDGHAKGLPVNLDATAIYQSFARSKGRPIDDAAVIVGPAVLFDRPVWF